jgi:hypothetical protein
LQHAGRAIYEKAHAVGAPGGKIAPLEHPLEQAGSEQQCRVRREIAGVVSGAEAAALVGEKQRIQLSGDPALCHVPTACCFVDERPAVAAKVAEPVGEGRNDQLATLSGREIDGGRFADAYELVGCRITGLVGIALVSLFG